MPEKLKFIDSETLLQAELPLIQFIVDKILAQGFYTLAGLPQTGKSWLLLILCIKVALGEPF